MTAGQIEHEAVVTAWLHRAACGSPFEIIEAFEHAFNAVWRRAYLTLGEITLAAIVERVLQSASERYPPLLAIVVTESGLRCESLRTTGLHEDQARTASQFVLLEFLTVLGNLTAEILTPALHDELSKCSSEGEAR